VETGRDQAGERSPIVLVVLPLDRVFLDQILVSHLCHPCLMPLLPYPGQETSKLVFVPTSCSPTCNILRVLSLCCATVIPRLATCCLAPLRTPVCAKVNCFGSSPTLQRRSTYAAKSFQWPRPAAVCSGAIGSSFDLVSHCTSNSQS